MDYEKKYNDALDWMRKVYPSLEGTDKEDAEYYFSELIENKNERIRKELIEFLDELWHSGKDTNFDKWSKADCTDWIDYLKKQEEQQTIEWSKEDKDMRTKIIGYLSSFIYPNSFYGDDAKECITWLKSLPKSHWKPSAEQLVTLKHIALYNTYNIASKEVLLSLYKELIKL